MLNRAVGGRASTRSESCGKSGIMSTYEELMIILATASLIVAILKYVRKK